MTDTTVPAWLATMQSEIGIAWAPGDGRSSTIAEWLAYIGNAYPEMAGYCNAAAHLDYFSWCGAGVGYCTARAGIRPVFGSTDVDQFLYATAWLEWGTQVDTPLPGDVVVFNFGGGDHHVTLFVGDNGDGTWKCLGANQSHQVKYSNYPKSAVMGVRHPSAAGTIPSPPLVPSISNLPSTQVFTNIYATTFGGSGDHQISAYDEKIITDTEYGVSFPARLAAPLPRVAVSANGKTCVCAPRDIGPWNLHDSYWLTGARPLAESQFANHAVAQNGQIPTQAAGIDLTPAADAYLGNRGGGRVTWWFVDPSTPLGPSSLLPPGTTPMPSEPAPMPVPAPVPVPVPSQSPSSPFDPALVTQLMQLAGQLLQQKLQQPQTQQNLSTGWASVVSGLGTVFGFVSKFLPQLSAVGAGLQIFTAVMGWMSPMIATGSADPSTASQATGTALATGGIVGILNWVQKFFQRLKPTS